MTSNQKTKLSDFTNDELNDKPDKKSNGECDTELDGDSTAQMPDEPNECPTLIELSDQVNAPDDQEQCNGPICSTFHEERNDERWQRLLAEHFSNEPACGHVIDYLKNETEASLSIRSADKYNNSLTFYVAFLHERDVNVCEAGLRDLRMYFNMRAHNNRSRSTLEGDRSALTNLYKHIRLYRDAEPTLSRELILEEIDPSAFQTKEPFEREPLTKKEVSQMLDETNGLKERLIILVGVELGPRNTDICKLKTSDVDLEEKMITLSNTKAGGEYKLPLSDSLALLLRRWIEVERPATGVAENNPYLFPSPKGGSYSSEGLCGLVQRVAERAGIQEVIDEIPVTENQKDKMGIDRDVRNAYKVDVHTLRHTFNHLMEEAEIPREARSAALDHSNTDTTKEFYDHNDSGLQKYLENLFKGVSEFDLIDEDKPNDC